MALQLQRHFYVRINNCMTIDGSGSLYYKLGATQFTMMFKAKAILNDSKILMQWTDLHNPTLHRDAVQFINSICMDAAQLARAALLAIEL